MQTNVSRLTWTKIKCFGKMGVVKVARKYGRNEIPPYFKR